MALRLSASALYDTGGDLVTVDAWLEDPATGKFQPQEVKAAAVDLLLGGEAIVIASVEYDRRHGSSDGATHVGFLHPPAARDLKARVVVETYNDGVFQQEVPVSLQVDATPLAEQPGSL